MHGIKSWIIQPRETDKEKGFAADDFSFRFQVMRFMMTFFVMEFCRLISALSKASGRTNSLKRIKTVFF